MQTDPLMPPVPEQLRSAAVAVWSQPISIPTYLPEPAESYPMFFNTRVYQASNGRVAPLPYGERISPEPQPHTWRAVHLQNEWIRLVILPELGGRLHIAYDRVAAYHLFYKNSVIKPALVGLAGPWISGGVEFNWPQHHRPATFLPTDVHIEEEPDGAVTVWCSDHDPQTRMKGMHGLRLRPECATIEARVRLYNRTEQTQTFLWWANVAVAVNDDYQSFFPDDVTMVTDHLRRAVVAFPEADRPYYGYDYPVAAQEDPSLARLDWWRNIPVPTSYMASGSRQDFFGGYDHGAQAGFVHWADHRVSPGKKQWTWGTAEVGRAWERNLTDADGPYIELMAGVFSDNQPDFAHLAPGETKTFSQFWYPIHQIGVPQDANLEVAGNATREDTMVTVQLITPLRSTTVDVVALQQDHEVTRRQVDLACGRATTLTFAVTSDADVMIAIERAGHRLLTLGARGEPTGPSLVAAVEPPLPAEIATNDELLLVGQYLAQYRHATRSPERYWLAALERDPADVRCSVALATRYYRDARFAEAEVLLRRAIDRQTRWVPTPSSGEAMYLLGLVLVALGQDVQAAEQFGRAAWDAAWSAPSGWQLARIACRAHDFAQARRQLSAVINLHPDHLQAANLLIALDSSAGRPADRAPETALLLADVLRRDPLDPWARYLAGRPVGDAGALLDVAIEYADCGLTDQALGVLDLADQAATTIPSGQINVGPLVAYHRAALTADPAGRTALSTAAQNRNVVHCQASRLSDVAALRRAVEHNTSDGQARYLLGCWYVHHDRPDSAIEQFQSALAGQGPQAAVHRALGIVLYNHRGDPDGAIAEFEAALRADPDSPRLWFEHDQLVARSGIDPAVRLARLRARPDIVIQRDDLTVVLANLLTSNGEPDVALELLRDRHFQPWEGGEGQVIDAWESAQVAIATAALDAGDAPRAMAAARAAWELPVNLAEGRYPEAVSARVHVVWATAARAAGDRQAAAAQRALAAAQLPRLTSQISQLSADPAVPFFATSLPAPMMFVDDLQHLAAGRLANLQDQVSVLRAAMAHWQTDPLG